MKDPREFTDFSSSQDGFGNSDYDWQEWLEKAAKRENRGFEDELENFRDSEFENNAPENDL